MESESLDFTGLEIPRDYIFGKEGDGFERINIAYPRKILEQALGQLKEAVVESGY